MACDLDGARDQASDAAADARAVGDPVFEAAALAGGAIASASAGEGREAVEAAAAAFERLTPEQLATRLPGFWMLGRSRRCLGQYEAALADLDRGAALARETGRENVRLQVTVERVAVLIELGRLAEATAAAEQGVELARLAGNPPMLLWARCALSSARLAAGDVGAAVQHAEEAVASGVAADFHAAGQPAWALGAALAAAGEERGSSCSPRRRSSRPTARRSPRTSPRRAGRTPRGSRRPSGPCLEWPPPARRPLHGRPPAARRGPRARRPLRGHRGAARGRGAFASFGALRRRDEAVGSCGGSAIASARARAASRDGDLTAREREIAELVAAGRTNREVAAQLVLSERTIEAHLRNVYAKLGVRSRVELTRRLTE
jgi:DNA-binding CsgD family transcriptional regulator